MSEHQVAIMGGGPAGLAAALTLSRSMIRTVLIDSEAPPRNAASPHIGALPAADMIAPEEFRNTVAGEIDRYGFVERRNSAVAAISEQDTGTFSITTSDGLVTTAGRILMATGMIDVFPEIEGLNERWGKSVINCPFCQGFEHRDRPWGIYVHRPEILDAAEIYLNWTKDLVMFIGPEIQASDGRRQQLEGLGVKLVFESVTGLQGDGPDLSSVQMADGSSIDRDVLLVWPHQVQSDLVGSLGLPLTDEGYVIIDEGYRTGMQGIYAAGDLVYGGHQNTNTAIHMGNMAAASMVFDICKSG